MSNEEEYTANLFVNNILKFNCNDQNETFESTEDSPKYYTLDAQVSKLPNLLENLLGEWEMESVWNIFQKSKLNDITDLKILTESDLNVMFPDQGDLGIKCRLRAKIVEWRIKHDYPVHSFSLSSIETNNCIVTTSSRNTSPSAPLSLNETTDAEFQFEFKNFVNSERGTRFIGVYNKNGSLDDETRKLLIEAIVQEFVVREKNMTAPVLEKISEDIAKYFPGEDKELYYKGGRKPSGKLYNKFRNSSYKLKKVGLYKNQPKKRSIETSAEKNDQPETFTEDFEENKKWLSYMQTPWETVELKWKDTARGRQNEIKSSKSLTVTPILNSWPLLKSATAFRLIEIDFDIVYPDKSFKLYDKWNSFIKNLPSILSSKIKNKAVVEELKNLPKDEDYKNYKLLQMLHYVLKPTTRITSKLKTNVWKPSIQNSIKSFAVEVGSMIELEKIIQEKQQHYVNYDITLQPLIAVISDGNYYQYAIIFDGIYFKFDNFVKCLDICFKMFFVFNLKYPIECSKVWDFLQVYLYEIDSVSTFIPEIKSLIVEIEKIE